MWRRLLWCVVACFTLAATLRAQQADQEIIRQLVEKLADNERRIQVLEQKLAVMSVVPATETASAASPVPATQVAQTPPTAVETKTVALAARDQPAPQVDGMQGHSMELPGGGPTLNIR